MKRLLAAIAVLSACACSPPAAQPTAHHEVSTGCIANAETRWTRANAPALDANASTVGPDCAHAVATLIVRDPSGVAVYTEAFPAEHIMQLAGAQDSAAMQGALVQWISLPTDRQQTTADLPAWAADAEAPTSGEFQFMPEPSVDRAAYAALRVHPVAMYCVVQGMESQACLAWRDNALTKIGVQAFPG